MTRSIKRIVTDWRIKVYGYVDGERVNHLVGWRGLVECIGEDLAVKFVDRAYASGQDICHCKLRRGIKVSFYNH